MLHFDGSCHQLPQDRNIVPDPTTRLLDLVDRRGLVRARDAATAGIPTVYLTRLVRAGALERVARGLYAGASSPVGLAVVRMHPRALAAGVVVHDVDGTPVPVFDPSKTIADLFKFRSGDRRAASRRRPHRAAHHAMDEGSRRLVPGQVGSRTSILAPE